MKRVVGVAGALLLSLFVLLPVVAAADPEIPHTGRVLMSVNGDVTVPAGEHADAVVVVRGTATIAGEVNTIVVVDGSATLDRARSETIVAIHSPVTIGDGSQVLGEVLTVDSLVTKTGNAEATVRNVTSDLAGFGIVLARLFILWMIGVAVATILAAMLLAGIATRQVREAGALISHEPVLVAGAGLAGIVLPILIAIPLIASVVGAPLALGLLLGLWPLAAFVGYLVAAIWVGEFIVTRMTPEMRREKPYFAAAVGVVVLAIASIFPPLAMLAGFFGFGAVLLLAWRALRGRPTPGLQPQWGPPLPGTPTPTGPTAPTPVAG